MAISISISITQNSQSITGNTSNVTVKVNASWTYGSYNLNNKPGTLTIDGTAYSFTSPFNTGRTTSGSATLFTKTVNVSHASNGSKTLSCSASYTSGVSSGTVSASASKVLTTIPRKSTLSVANGTLGTAQTLSITRQSTSFTHTITYTCGSASGTICTKSTATSISFTPPITLASQNTTGTSVAIAFKIETFNGSTSLGSNSYTKNYAIPESVKPSVSFVADDPTGNLATYGKYVSGKSKVSVIISASGIYDSEIKSYNTTIDGKSYTDASFTSDILTGNGTLTVNVTVTDSRGRTATASKDIAVYAYESPKITALTIKRCDSSGASSSSGAYLGITFSASVTSLDSKNTASYQVKYKKVSDTAYTTATISGYANNYSVNNGTYVFAADASSSYDVVLSVIDAFGTVSKTTIGGTTNKLLSFMRKGLGIAMGKVAEIENALDVNFDLYARKTSYFKGTIYDKKDNEVFGVTQEYLLEHVYPVGSYYISHNDTSPAELFGGTWYRVESRFLYGCASSGTPGLTGGSRTVDISHSHLAPSGYDSTYYYSTNYWGDAIQTVSGTGAGYGYKASSSVSTTQVRLSRTADALGEIAVMPPYVNVALWRRTA